MKLNTKSIDFTYFKSLSHSRFIIFLQFIDDAFGFDILDSTPDISDDLKRKIGERVTAKVEKDYARADELRDEILAQGIELLDGADKVIWKYKG